MKVDPVKSPDGEGCASGSSVIRSRRTQGQTPLGHSSSSMPATISDPCETGACDHPDHTGVKEGSSQLAANNNALASSTAEGVLVEDVLNPATFIAPQTSGLPYPSVIIEFCDRVSILLESCGDEASSLL